MDKMGTLAECMYAYEIERLAKLAADLAIHDLPGNVAARAAKSRAEFQTGVKSGWWDADGTPIQGKDDEETEEDEPLGD